MTMLKVNIFSFIFELFIIFMFLLILQVFLDKQFQNCHQKKNSNVDNIHFTLVLLRDHIQVTISPRIHCLVVFSFFFLFLIKWGIQSLKKEHHMEKRSKNKMSCKSNYSPINTRSLLFPNPCFQAIGSRHYCFSHLNACPIVWWGW